MYFRDIFGLEEIKRTLITAFKQNHVAHAQLFAGAEGSASLAMALAYIRYIFCHNKGEYDSCGSCSACRKLDKLTHPDLHFVFPTSSTPKITKPLSQDLLKEWREFALQKTYAGITEWLEHIGAESKMPNISAEESRKIITTLSLMPFESDFKVMLIWLPELMHPTASNALLKILEEPPPQTLFFLVSQEPEKLLITILSRLQPVRIRSFKDEEVKAFLQEKMQTEPFRAEQIAHLAEGNLLKAQYLAQEIADDNHSLFRNWMRLCYARKYADLYKMTEDFAKMPKEAQRNLLQYGLNMCQETLVYRFAEGKLNRLSEEGMTFVQGFAKTIHTENITKFYELLNNAIFYLERNANPKIVFLETSLQISQIIR